MSACNCFAVLNFSYNHLTVTKIHSNFFHSFFSLCLPAFKIKKGFLNGLKNIEIKENSFVCTNLPSLLRLGDWEIHFFIIILFCSL